MLDFISSHSAASWSLGAEMNPWTITICAMAGSSSRALLASPDCGLVRLPLLSLHRFLRRRSLSPHSCFCGKDVPCKHLTTVVPLQPIDQPTTGFDTFICDPAVARLIALRGCVLWHSGRHQLRERDINIYVYKSSHSRLDLAVSRLSRLHEVLLLWRNRRHSRVVLITRLRKA